MNITVTIDSTDRTDVIQWESLQIDDIAGEQANTCRFIIKKYDGQTFKPSMGDEVVVADGAETLFAGKIWRISESVEGAIMYFDVVCKDYTLDLDRINVAESFQNETVDNIVQSLVDDYLSGTGITYSNVNCPVTIETVKFNNIPVSKCLEILAEKTNYFWYVDYDKDIHFFAKNSEVAPFKLTDDSDDDDFGKFIWNSLKLTTDLSQLRNAIFIRGAEKVANYVRTKRHIGDGSQTVFGTDLKYSSKPTVTVDSVAQDVGVEYLDSDDDFDCLWDYNQKTIRFVTAPADTAVVEFEGYPLIPIWVQVEEEVSIANFGRFEFFKFNNQLQSSEEALQYAQAQIEAYGNSVREGRFETYTSGLYSGQTISIQITSRSISEQFVIQRVSFRMRTQSEGMWVVELATLRTMGIISFLQKKLLNEYEKISINENDLIEKYRQISETIQVTEEISVKAKEEDFQTVEVTEEIDANPFGSGVSPEFVWTPYAVTGQTDQKREFVWDRGYWG